MDCNIHNENNNIIQSNNKISIENNNNKKNPALLEVERRMWIKNSTLPQWIKDKILNDEKEI